MLNYRGFFVFLSQLTACVWRRNVYSLSDRPIRTGEA